MRRSLSGGAVDLIVAGAGAAILASWMLRRRRRIRFAGASVVITGGSRGLGLELARLFAEEGARLSLLARSEGELERASRELAGAGADVLVYRCDVRDRLQVEATVDSITRDRGRIDVLVNNAGIVQVGPFENQELSDFEESLAVHAWGPLFMIRAVAPLMKRQGGGRIVNISSIGGLVAIPHLLPYCVGKFALTGLSDGLRAELAGAGIRVTTVAPGLMRTGSHLNAFFKGQYRKEFAWFSLSGANPLLSAASRRAARRIVEACRYGDPRLVITLPAKLLHVADTLFPRVTAACSGAAARLLPAPAGAGGNELHTGWESRSPLAPSLLTRAADAAVERNNESLH
jgi:NAD(P)-dependent dehydrogenase (short-subunit alcohol dehydrogenase family)